MCVISLFTIQRNHFVVLVKEICISIKVYLNELFFKFSEKSLHESCSSNDQCKDVNAECADSICTCKDMFFKNADVCSSSRYMFLLFLLLNDISKLTKNYPGHGQQ